MTVVFRHTGLVAKLTQRDALGLIRKAQVIDWVIKKYFQQNEWLWQRTQSKRQTTQRVAQVISGLSKIN